MTENPYPQTDAAVTDRAPGPLGWCAKCLAQGQYHPAATLQQGTSLCESCVTSQRPSGHAIQRVAQRLPDPVARRMPQRMRGAPAGRR